MSIILKTELLLGCMHAQYIMFVSIHSITHLLQNYTWVNQDFISPFLVPGSVFSHFSYSENVSEIFNQQLFIMRQMDFGTFHLDLSANQFCRSPKWISMIFCWDVVTLCTVIAHNLSSYWGILILTCAHKLLLSSCLTQHILYYPCSINAVRRVFLPQPNETSIFYLCWILWSPCSVLT